MTLGYIGLGKMGANMVARLVEKKYTIIATDPNETARVTAQSSGAQAVENITEMIAALPAPRTIWIMVPWKVVGSVLKELTPLLTEGDMVIDGGNSPYTETIRRAKELGENGIHFMDAGISGGPRGACDGACTMVGATTEDYREYTQLFADISAPDAYGHMGDHGAGHFVKMVHNGIEYGMMQAIGEGFAIMKASAFNINLTETARVYNHQSVIASRLVKWLEDAYREQGEDLAAISGEVHASGEGQWTVDAAQKLNIAVPVINDALEFRKNSHGNPSYTGQVVSALRGQFGGHPVTKK